MTCIVGVKSDKGCVFGGDSITVSETVIRKTSGPKVFKKGTILFGNCGSVILGNSLFDLEIKEKVKPNINSVYESIVIPFKTLLKKRGLLEVHLEMERLNDSAFLVGIEDRIFSIYPDTQVDEYQEPYAALGCGEEFALGSLHSSYNESPENRVKMALEASAYHCTKVCEPFNIIRNY